MPNILLILCFGFVSSILTKTYETYMGERDTPLVIRTPKIYNINLDESYEERWRPVLKDFALYLNQFIASLDLKIQPILKIFDKFDYPIMVAYNKEFAKEIKAISKLTSHSFTLISALNFIYDISAQCTSILVQDPQGNVYHGRNLDFSYAPYLANLTFHGRYFKNGKLLYEAISIAGYTGLITGIKPNAYSFSIDQYILPRDPNTFDDIQIFISDIVQLLRRKQSPTNVVRTGFETIPDYEGFVKYLKETDTVSKAFYIIAGAKQNQGVVITKFRNKVQNTTTLNPQAGRWFVAQTNYKGNIPDPKNDNRATAAIDWLNEIGWNEINKDNLVSKIFTIYPIFNNETLHTTIMQPSTGYFNTTLWY